MVTKGVCAVGMRMWFVVCGDDEKDIRCEGMGQVGCVLDFLLGWVAPKLLVFTAHGGSLWYWMGSSGSDEEFDVRGVRVVSAINPLSVGGGRNRLPRSFERLFTVISLQEMSDDEIRMAAHNLFVDPNKRGGSLSAHFLGRHNVPVFAHRATEVLLAVRREVAVGALGQEGGPYVFNLRDVEKLDAVLTANARALWQHICTFVDGGCRNPSGASSDDLRVLIWRKLLKTVVLSRFRGAADRARVQELINSQFPAPSGALASGWDDMDVDVTIPGFVRVGAMYVNSSGRLPELDPDVVYNEPFVSLLEQLLLAVNANLPVLIEGGTATMKSLSVRELARLLGKHLHVIPLSADTEIADLLGQFVLAGHGSAPTNVTLGEAKSLCTAVQFGAGALVAELYHRVDGAALRGLELSRQMLTLSPTCLSVVSSVWTGGGSSASTDAPLLAQVVAAGGSLLEWAVTISSQVSEAGLSLQGLLRYLPSLLAVLRQAHNALITDPWQQQQQHSGTASEKGIPSFLWRDGKLVQAMNRGEWALLEGVSNAPQEVLERLNPALEYKPSLVLDGVRDWCHPLLPPAAP
jgi:hypothetical protein